MHGCAAFDACLVPTDSCCLQWQNAQPTLSLEGLTRGQEGAQLEVQYEPCLTLVVQQLEDCRRRRAEGKAAMSLRQEQVQGAEEDDDELEELEDSFQVSDVLDFGLQWRQCALDGTGCIPLAWLEKH